MNLTIRMLVSIFFVSACQGSPQLSDEHGPTASTLEQKGTTRPSEDDIPLPGYQLACNILSEPTDLAELACKVANQSNQLYDEFSNGSEMTWTISQSGFAVHTRTTPSDPYHVRFKSSLLTSLEFTDDLSRLQVGVIIENDGILIEAKQWPRDDGHGLSPTFSGWLSNSLIDTNDQNRLTPLNSIGTQQSIPLYTCRAFSAAVGIHLPGTLSIESPPWTCTVRTLEGDLALSSGFDVLLNPSQPGELYHWEPSNLAVKLTPIHVQGLNRIDLCRYQNNGIFTIGLIDPGARICSGRVGSSTELSTIYEVLDQP
ncbi:hypothetical protein [Pseudobacteriovorax antillogorgiicola]|uniref:Uncharacterized protein n=1 Tax=Pseudobacteriovorax antillogorgiicola TaxID=1513793 RepID=A0A1Y6CIN5_9BACT|nr:hypothetical protein [Pseudobacteriovorax antillogorgiicola]TCS46358.1 hypothetical protein EDD56_12422 [Pseudobacteriovorax antillogorgiicola]SMF68235.1 hypothetical protein SAMN06296036_12422 [Pseudobacteriovorax antillogorgiicola]